jgi:hypothetical protein
MTTCTPLKPFRCWQYRKDSTERVPKWVEACFDSWGYRPLSEDGIWLVDVAPLDAAVFTPAEFAERFRVEEGK